MSWRRLWRIVTSTPRWVHVSVALAMMGGLWSEHRQRMRAPDEAFTRFELDEMVSGVNKQLPRRIDSDTVLVRVEAVAGRFVYDYALSDDIPRTDRASYEAEFMKAVPHEVCENTEVRELMKRRLSIRHVYRTPDGATIASVDVSRQTCESLTAR